MSYHASNSTDSRRQPLVALLMIASIFSGAFILELETFTTNMGPILAAVATVIALLRQRIIVSQRGLIFASLIAIHGLLAIAIGSTTFNLFIKTYGAALILFWGFSLMLRSSRSLEDFIKAYLAGAVIVAIVGLVQAFGWLSAIPTLYDYSWLSGWKLVPGGLIGIRINSLLYEPSQIGFTMGPAFCFAVMRIIGKCRHLMGMASAVAIIVVNILAVSSSMIAVAGVFGAILIIGGSGTIIRLSLTLSVPVITLFGMGFFQSTVEKYFGLVESFTQVGAGQFENATTFTLYFHFKLAWQNFVETWGFGGGIGSHEVLASKTLESILMQHNVYNLNSAGNLTFRLLSEFGVFGIAALVAFGLFVVKGAKQFKGDTVVYHAAFGAGVFGFLIRNGTYAQYGIAFYVIVLVYIARQEHKSRRRSKPSSQSQLALA